MYLHVPGYQEVHCGLYADELELLNLEAVTWEVVPWGAVST